MTKKDIEAWQSDESEKYANSPDHKRVQFLGKRFLSIKCGSRIYKSTNIQKLITLDKLLSWAGVLGAQQLYLPAPHGKRQGSICHDDKWRIDPSSYPDVCLVDNMAVWWFRTTCFHGLKYLCVNREVLKQNYIMRTEMKASNECLYPTDVFLVTEVSQVNKYQLACL